MFDEIRDFVAKHKIWFIIVGIICAMFGAVMAALISLYFLIAVAVGLIIAVVSGLNNQSLEDYKREARKKITKQYVEKLIMTEIETKDTSNDNTCSILIQDMGDETYAVNTCGIRRLLEKHFRLIPLSQCSLTKIRGDIEVFFEVLTGVNYSNAREGQRYEFQIRGVWQLTESEGLDGSHSGMSVRGALKCFFEHTILCASNIYQDKKYHNSYKQALLIKENLSIPDFYQRVLGQQFPIAEFEDWEHNHTHSNVL